MLQTDWQTLPRKQQDMEAASIPVYRKKERPASRKAGLSVILTC